MQYENQYLTEQLQRMRFDEMRRGAERERFMAEHELDLMSLLRRALRRRMPRQAERADTSSLPARPARGRAAITAR